MCLGKMFELRGPNGKYLFERIQISLVCNECMQTDTPEQCTHLMHLMPRWLSSSKMEVVRELLSEDPSMLLRESLGVAADSSVKAFASSDIARFLDPNRVINLQRTYQEQVWEVTIAVDPSGGGGSNFAICSIATDIKTGHTVVGDPPLRISPLQSANQPKIFPNLSNFNQPFERVYEITGTLLVLSRRFQALTCTLLATWARAISMPTPAPWSSSSSSDATSRAEVMALVLT